MRFHGFALESLSVYSCSRLVTWRSQHSGLYPPDFTPFAGLFSPVISAPRHHNGCTSERRPKSRVSRTSKFLGTLEVTSAAHHLVPLPWFSGLSTPVPGFKPSFDTSLGRIDTLPCKPLQALSAPLSPTPRTHAHHDKTHANHEPRGCLRSNPQ